MTAPLTTEPSPEPQESASLPEDRFLDRELSRIEPVDLADPSQIQEFVSHAYYDYAGGKDLGLHPYAGETQLNYTGPPPPFTQLDVEQAYSWMKSPRWRGKAMEVGPLARLAMLYAKGHEPTQALADHALRTLDLPLTAIFSTLGRTAARTIESKVFADQMIVWLDNLVANIKAGDSSVHNAALWEPSTWPAEVKVVMPICRVPENSPVTRTASLAALRKARS